MKFADLSPQAIEKIKGYGLDELHDKHEHMGWTWGASEGVAAAALPVLLALILRWLIFAPGGTTDAWSQLLTRPTLSLIAVVAMLAPLLRFPRRRYAIALWTFFWGLSLIAVVWPTTHW